MAKVIFSWMYDLSISIFCLSYLLNTDRYIAVVPDLNRGHLLISHSFFPVKLFHRVSLYRKWCGKCLTLTLLDSLKELMWVSIFNREIWSTCMFNCEREACLFHKSFVSRNQQNWSKSQHQWRWVVLNPTSSPESRSSSLLRYFSCKTSHQTQ